MLIHAVYLLNCASEDREIRAKSLTSLTHSLRVGHAIGAAGVVLHPGSALEGPRRARRSSVPARRSPRRSPTARAASSTSRTRRAPAARSGARSRSSPRCSTPRAAEARLGVCLDSCHLLASGYDIRTPAGMPTRVLRRGAPRARAAGRIRSLHLNDSKTPLGSNRDRHANVGEGELGEKGCAAFLSAPGLQRLPCVLETPGEKREGPGPAEIGLARRLRERGLAARRR